MLTRIPTLFFSAGLLLHLGACQSSSFTNDENPGGEGDDDSGNRDDDDDAGAPPIADAGETQWVTVGHPVLLDGSQSYDPEGQALTFSWTLTGVPPGSLVTVDPANEATVELTPDLPGTYTASLTVSDGGSAGTDSVHVNVEEDVSGDDDDDDGPNQAPIADAGPDQILADGTEAWLDGTGSSDPDGDELVFQWTFQSYPGDLPSFDAPYGSTTQTPRFSPQDPGTYILQLIVNDGFINSAADSVTVTVEDSGGGSDDGCGCGAAATVSGPDPLPGGIRLDLGAGRRGSPSGPHAIRLGIFSLWAAAMARRRWRRESP